MLTRIYGTAFFSKRTWSSIWSGSRRRGPATTAGSAPSSACSAPGEAPGMPFWLPQGTVLLRAHRGEVREQLDAAGYVEIRTPHILDEELWRRSGHWDNYRDKMFFHRGCEERRVRAASR